MRRAAFLTLLLTAAPVVAADPAITLDEALATAMTRNPALRASAAAEREARYAVNEAAARRRPKVSGVAQYETSDDEFTQLPDANQVVVRGEETLLDGPAGSDLRRLKALHGAAQAELEQKKLEVALEVREAYDDAVAASERLEVWAAAEDEFSHLLKFLAPKFNVGSVPEYDYASVRFLISQYQQNRLDSERELSHDLHRLAEAMGAEVPAAVAPLAAEAGPPPAVDASALVNAAFSDRPDVRSAALASQAAGADVDRARRERWPSLNVTGDYGLSAQKWRELANGYSFGGAVTLPITDFGGTSARVRQAEARRQEREAEMDALRLRVRTDLSDKSEAVRTAWAKLELVRDSLPSGRKAYESALHRYRTGLGPLTELNDAHDLWVQARVHVVDATLDYRKALAELAAERGRLEARP